jgi:hypothetical protein
VWMVVALADVMLVAGLELRKDRVGRWHRVLCRRASRCEQESQ